MKTVISELKVRHLNISADSSAVERQPPVVDKRMVEENEQEITRKEEKKDSIGSEGDLDGLQETTILPGQMEIGIDGKIQQMPGPSGSVSLIHSSSPGSGVRWGRRCDTEHFRCYK